MSDSSHRAVCSSSMVSTSVAFAAPANGCFTVHHTRYRLLLMGILPTSFFRGLKIQQTESQKSVAYLVAASLLIETRVMSIDRAYNTFFKRMHAFVLPFGISTYRSLRLVASKVCLSAAVMVFGVISTKLMKCSR